MGVTVMEVVVRKGEVVLMVDDVRGFKVYDFANATVEILAKPAEVGPPTVVVAVGDTLAMCYGSRKELT